MSDVDHIVNILLVGDSSVGKSNICTWFIKDEYMDQQMPTIGVDFLSKLVKIDTKTINVKIWDTAGQEKFYSMVWRVFKQSDGIVLVYDISNRKSFESLDRWLRQIKSEKQKD